ncbi:PTS galactosamine transporter subunit IIB [Clostridium chauvoei]|uniref:PTS N-acetylgalactosamine transporter subunit IIB n=2 Tax=Clostridium chauvoei TaxID=46867 RepID=A0ABD4RI70_9CLOT|nr:PTS galactosamine transporter subunit IIB [Clostridium chauvoei]ATD56006.1 PTS N-acetylgalactosamine transporter subunit IIB [Clostridium chauvoei]ATD56325.1 PTS N-acetylgalactosamine transporter subunit IIB [Clostridium chauvoei]MBX7280905.1 PTS N-acetylgalactosamine transporter subunit IIB [Clostridium chauvoei]MBX7283388.1 PTS N-acetylgalactosamine transporter subunit IIB [Clostridium chauvoei]MBX7285929.1 PTS N-acetylgalactosamine transporter subunit IIB [Clostridium chauvoei]
MPNILLTRVDNRLIHGQVGVTWVNHLGANLILVANDKVSADPVQQSLMDMVVPDAIQTRFFSIEKTIKVINKASAKQKIFLVCKTPQDALRLVEGGVPIKEINIGNMHFSEGKEQISSTVSIDEDDKKTLRKLIDLGVKVEQRRVPDERPEIDIAKFV